MSGHPLHGIKPQADKIRRASNWGDATSSTIWKARWRLPGGTWKAAICMGDQIQAVAAQLRAEGKEVDMSRL